jgi:hypothetical protein
MNFVGSITRPRNRCDPDGRHHARCKCWNGSRKIWCGPRDRNAASRPDCQVRWLGRILTATVRSRRVSFARYTSPIPPEPSCDRISYGPEFGARGKGPRVGAMITAGRCAEGMALGGWSASPEVGQKRIWRAQYRSPRSGLWAVWQKEHPDAEPARLAE